MVRVYRSSSGSERRSAVCDFIASFPPGTEILLLAASRGAADELAQSLAASAGTVFGLHRTTLHQLAGRAAATALAANGCTPVTALGAAAVAARAGFEVEQRGELRYFTPVARCPGFAQALAGTLAALRLAAVDRDTLGRQAGAGADLAEVLGEFENQLAAARLADTAALLRTATVAVQTGAAAVDVARPLAFFDVAVQSPLERDFIAALASAAPTLFATVPDGDDQTWAALTALGAQDESPQRPVLGSTNLDRLRHYLFSSDTPPVADADDTVSFFSAPGEARECVEIARRMLAEGAQGVPFDEMAVVLRVPHTYTASLENALRRAGIPTYFARGTRIPDPSGRAFLALLACAEDGLSARRFAEYLSLGEVPALTADGQPPCDGAAWVAPDDDALGLIVTPVAAPASAAADETPTQPETAPVVAGSLRAPWRWEDLLTEAAVIGGKARWARRLHGAEAELRVKLARVYAEEADSPRSAALARQLTDWAHLRRFALPVIEALAALPDAAPWSEWLGVLTTLAPAVLRRPERVLAVLAELQPLGTVGPVGLHEVRATLTNRLATLETAPPARRFGRVLVTTPDGLRGRPCDVVFVPGLAERLFPQKPREDPLLLDALRVQVSGALSAQADRSQRERLRLRLAVGAARRRLYLSYPRIDVNEGRPRVPSFYSLDVQRATRGRIPEVEAFERTAAQTGQARLAWPAPPDPTRAIDEAEHDLSVLGPLLRTPTPDSVRGRARYLLELNSHLARSLRDRWLRWQQSRWSIADGVARRTDATAPIFDQHRLTARPYSVSALQRFAACPYQFFLAAIQQLEPRATVAPLERLDPLTRGRLSHRIQADTLRTLAAEAMLPLDAGTLPRALVLLDDIVDRLADEYRDALAPAIERVWQDEIAATRADLRAWLRAVAAHDAAWQPLRIEFAFGLRSENTTDPRSVETPAVLPGGFRLRGAIDLVEQHRSEALLRVTDYKTGLNRTTPGVTVGGGHVLQPVLYGLAVEALLGTTVRESRLWFCTAAGGFATHVVALDEAARRRGREVLEIIDRAIAHGQLMPVPQPGACTGCDFRIVCGPYEEERCSRKDTRALADLLALRGLT